MKKLGLLILFGGKSNEHEVSRLSVASILKAINRDKYDITVLGVTKEGKWLITEASPEKIADGSWENEMCNIPATVNLGGEVGGLYTMNGDVIPIDCVFPVMHGRNAEDGTMQGLFKIAGLRFVGPGVLASATGMDKLTAKLVAATTGVAQARYHAVNRYVFEDNETVETKKITEKLGNKYPLFVKPANSGSSVGITKVNNQEELLEGIKIAAEIDHRILIEEGIVGREIEVAVLGNVDPKASPIGEIISSNEIYDYDAKYLSGESKTQILKDLPEKIQTEIREKAIEIYKAFDCRGLSRVDFFYTDTGNIVFNEINTLPGFTSISMYPQLWEAAGVEYMELIDKLICFAMEEI